MKKNTKIIIYVVAGIIILALVIIFGFKLRKKSSTNIKGIPPQTITVEPVTAAKGQLTENVPQGTVEQGNTIDSSYKFENNGTGTYTTEISSPKSVQEEYNYYMTFLKTLNLSVSSSKYAPDMATIFAYNQDENANVTITKQSNNTSILITYTK